MQTIISWRRCCVTSSWDENKHYDDGYRALQLRAILSEGAAGGLCEDVVLLPWPGDPDGEDTAAEPHRDYIQSARKWNEKLFYPDGKPILFRVSECARPDHRHLFSSMGPQCLA